MESDNITRHFNRFRYDEYTAFKSNPFKLSVLKKHEKKLYSSFFSKIEGEEYHRFFDVASRRKDKRSAELPERYDNFDYHSETASMGNSNDYLIVFRKAVSPKESRHEKVIDLLEIPIVRREY